MHEILTLQLGHRANFLATHFWNTQELYFTYDHNAAQPPIDHDVSFRPGLGADGSETFTPRTVIYDLKGGFGGLRKLGGLYDQPLHLDNPEEKSAQEIWGGNVSIQKDAQIEQSEYQKSLDEGIVQPPTPDAHAVRYWSDYNRVFYHPRSIIQINDYELGSSLRPFDKWDNGEELFAELDRDDDLLDRDVRPWAEECDQMQGIQIWTGADDAWGGFASRYSERLRDEYGKLELWAWAIDEQRSRNTRAKQLQRYTASMRTLNELSPQASIYCPLSIPQSLPTYSRLDQSSEWQVSALLSMAIEMMTLPSRLRADSTKRGLLGDMAAALNVNGNQRICQPQCSILDPDKEEDQADHDGQANSDSRLASHFEDDTPHSTKSPIKSPSLDLDIDLSGDDIALQSRSARKNRQTQFFGAATCLRMQVNGATSTEAGTRPEEKEDIGYARKRARFSNEPILEDYHIPLPYPLPTSFPPIISPSYILKPTNNTSTPSLLLQTSLTTSTRLAIRLAGMRDLVTGSGGGRGAARFLIPLDERESLGNSLAEMEEAYVEGWDSGGEESDDD